MPIRVIGGTAKGRRLKLVPGDTTRPVMDRVKEALFNILGTGLRDASFLDLFAGTGSVGIEALSRGAASALFIDSDRMAIRTIHENLALTGLADRATVLRVSAFDYLRRRQPRAFDYVYIAPPQYKTLWKDALLLLDEAPHHLNPDGVVIVQIDPSEQQPVTLSALEAYDERRYGKTLLWFFERIEPEPPVG
ncbi:MAG: 16S rRNA (guanine(966)-N(2))-methyltransferase RsmD [Chloroflexota bacterium]|nr:16S rRNA (guanine(966)-N(2))-methyltransferase RsmD [Anaerolineae bacterium]HMM26947.1 16S rRNA (guanine(966)-N(2))-methyltransferase RsmD [Aggregatilineaceae bacterium]